MGYDDENQLISWVRGSGDAGAPASVDDFKTEFRYDGLGRLRVKVEYYAEIVPEIDEELPVWVYQSETRYVYDGMRVIQERNGSNTPTVSYTRGTDLSGSMEGAGGIGGLLGRSTGNGTTWTSHAFYHADGNGNITYLVSSIQTLAASYRYDAYGNTLSQSGSLASANVYRFSSKAICEDTTFWGVPPLYYYGYRWYAPSLQRWPNRDPLSTKVYGKPTRINYLVEKELYSFVENSPVNFVDPDGLFQWYGNWGGSHWTAGWPCTWEQVVDQGLPQAEPIDNQDRCYQAHDQCHAACRDEFRAAPANRWKSAKLRLGSCLRGCDSACADCLSRLGDDPSNNGKAKLTRIVFRVLGTIGHTVELDPGPR